MRKNRYASFVGVVLAAVTIWMFAGKFRLDVIRVPCCGDPRRIGGLDGGRNPQRSGQGLRSHRQQDYDLSRTRGAARYVPYAILAARVYELGVEGELPTANSKGLSDEALALLRDDWECINTINGSLPRPDEIALESIWADHYGPRHANLAQQAERRRVRGVARSCFAAPTGGRTGSRICGGRRGSFCTSIITGRCERTSTSKSRLRRAQRWLPPDVQDRRGRSLARRRACAARGLCRTGTFVSFMPSIRRPLPPTTRWIGPFVCRTRRTCGSTASMKAARYWPAVRTFLSDFYAVTAEDPEIWEVQFDYMDKGTAVEQHSMATLAANLMKKAPEADAAPRAAGPSPSAAA